MSGFRFSRLFRPFNRMAGERSGVAAVEFALILPLMLSIYIGGNELGQALTIKRKITHATSTIADLVTQSKKITNADMTNILNSADEVLWPYPTTDMRIVVSLIKIDADNVATVVWSDARNDTPLVTNTTVEVPDNVNTANTYVVNAEIHREYTPGIGYVLTGSIDLWNSFYLRPRQGASITRTAS